MPAEQIRQEAYALIDTMSSYQVAAVVGLLRTMLDPVSRSLANAPYDDEPVSEAERLEIAEQDRWLAEHPDDLTDHADVLAEFGLSPTMEPLACDTVSTQQHNVSSSAVGEQVVVSR